MSGNVILLRIVNGKSGHDTFFEGDYNLSRLNIGDISKECAMERLIQ